MKTYPVDTAVTVTVPYIDYNGDPVQPTTVNVRVIDQDGNVVHSQSGISVTPGDTDLNFVVPAEANHLSDVYIGSRSVEVSLNTLAGIYPSSVTYILRKAQRLVPLQNSFQTFEQAAAEAAQMPRMMSWESASNDDKINALAEAFRRLTTIGYRIRRPEDVDTMSYIPDDDEVIQPRYWPLMTEERWNLLPARFKSCLRKAQIAEANEILTGDVSGAKRRSGILSETIGESSMMFRSGKPMEMGISSASLEYLTGYVEIRVTLTRS